MNLKSEAKQLESGPEADVTALAAAIADASRVKMLCALMDGRAWTATELAAAADIAASTASPICRSWCRDVC